MVFSYIEDRAEKLLNEFNLYFAPVDVFKCGDLLGIDVRSEALDPEIAGVLIKKDGASHIRFNSADSLTRQRFTVAHEIGHYLLHSQPNSLFIDKTEKVMYRNNQSSTGEILKEREANAFAAALLMPSQLIHELTNLLTAVEHENYVDVLAKKFNVSEFAMGIRLSNMGLLEYGHF